MPKLSIYLLYTGYPIKCPSLANNQLYSEYINKGINAQA